MGGKAETRFGAETRARADPGSSDLTTAAGRIAEADRASVEGGSAVPVDLRSTAEASENGEDVRGAAGTAWPADRRPVFAAVRHAAGETGSRAAPIFGEATDLHGIVPADAHGILVFVEMIVVPVDVVRSRPALAGHGGRDREARAAAVNGRRRARTARAAAAATVHGRAPARRQNDMILRARTAA